MSLFRCLNVILVTQQPTDTMPSRNKTLFLTAINKYEVITTWETMTDTAKITIPKNLYEQNINAVDGSIITMKGNNIPIGQGVNVQQPPLFLKGDKISLQTAYWYNDQFGNEVHSPQVEIFSGYISKIISKLEITLECEDNMFLLKQIPVPNQSWGGYSAQNIINTCLSGKSKGAIAAIAAGITVSTKSISKFTFDNGTLITSNISLAQLLQKLRCEMGMPSYFKSNVLRIWYPVYYEEDVQSITNPYQFIFQQNIISDNLQYQRKDDIVLSAVATNMYTTETGVTTSDGQQQTRKKQMKVFVYSDPFTQTIKSMVITNDAQIPPNTQGQRFDFKFADCPTITELTNRAKSELEKAYYTGFKGSFITFGMPYIPLGDNIILKDKVIPDRNGTYKVKAVTYTGGVGIGLRQEIHLAYLIQS